MRFNSLSGRLLLLTVIFVMIAEVAIFVPSVARFRADYLQERLERAQIASLALLATPNDMVAPALEAELLANAGVINIVLRRNAVRELVLSTPMPDPVAETYDMRDASPIVLIRDALIALPYDDGRTIRVVGTPVQAGGAVIEITMQEGPLRVALRDYALRILYLSLFISAVTATLLFLAVRRFITAPIDRVVRHMARFQKDPEDPDRLIAPEASIHELQVAETALRDMQERVVSALKQKDRLAALGRAVAKISHDLRNMLTVAQLVADRLEQSEDPAVKRSAPRLVGAIDRAVNLCEATLAYGKSEEPEPELRNVALHGLVEDVLESERLASEGRVSFANEVEAEAFAEADPEQLHRVLLNLVRNARQAIEAQPGGGCVTISSSVDGAQCCLLIRDSGPGLPNKALEHLFEPFQGSQRRGGAGLGLAIAAELVRGHRGSLELLETSTEGTVFKITLPHPVTPSRTSG
ncbi:MAG: HAMP domain-containing sensor histidine kinase [Pseudomonadota bacterium]